MIRIYLSMFLVFCLSGCSSLVEDPAARSRMNHVVLCWLKERGNIDHRKRIIEASRALSDIPGVLEVRAGQVFQSGRDIGDDSFDIGIYFAFRTPEDLKNYVTHPSHRDAVKNVLMPLAERIVVYDFMEEYP